MLLEEFDFDKSAVIEPTYMHHPVEGFPETVVSIFHHTLFHCFVDFVRSINQFGCMWHIVVQTRS